MCVCFARVLRRAQVQQVKQQLKKEEQQENQQRAQYRAGLQKETKAAKMQHEHSLKAQVAEFKKQAALKAEQAARATAEFEVSLGSSRDKAEVAARTVGETRTFRENFKLHLERMRVQAAEQRKTVLEGLELGFGQFGAGAKDFLADSERMGATVGVLAACALGVYGARTATGVAGRYIESRIGKPSLVRESSRVTLGQALRSPLATMSQISARRQGGTDPDKALAGVVLAPALDARLRLLSVRARSPPDCRGKGGSRETSFDAGRRRVPHTVRRRSTSNEPRAHEPLLPPTARHPLPSSSSLRRASEETFCNSPDIVRKTLAGDDVPTKIPKLISDGSSLPPPRGSRQSLPPSASRARARVVRPPSRRSSPSVGRRPPRHARPFTFLGLCASVRLCRRAPPPRACADRRPRPPQHSTMNTKRHGAPFRHVLLHGPPGTGKTLFAKKLAEASGLHYAIMTGGDVAPLGRDAVTEMHKMFEWSNATSGGVLLFVDEADAFLRRRATEMLSEDLRNSLNAFLYRTVRARRSEHSTERERQNSLAAGPPLAPSEPRAAALASRASRLSLGPCAPRPVAPPPPLQVDAAAARPRPPARIDRSRSRTNHTVSPPVKSSCHT